MTIAPERPTAVETRPWPAEPVKRGTALTRLLRTTDAKTIGLMYTFTAFAFFFVGGLLALVIRTELAQPGLQILTNEQYNQFFTMHGLIMLLLFATPLVFGYANYMVPLQIGAPDVAFPRLNALSYWLFLFGGIIAASSFFTPGGAPGFGWFAYPPLSDAVNTPQVGANLGLLGLMIGGIGTILGAVNMITTIITMRAPGMTMFRMSVFTWTILVTSLLVILVFPVIAATFAGLMVDRLFDAQIYSAGVNGPVLYQHLFWFFGHPEVYILALPFFGVISEIIPVFSRRPIFGYKGLIFATIAIAVLSMSVWAHHMYVTGAVLLPFFAFLTLLIAVPTGVKIFNWIGTMWTGSVKFDTPMLFAAGFLLTFLFGGITGVMLASPPIDFHVSDSYFVVAHFHYVLFGVIVFAAWGGLYFWFPKMTGRMLDERLGKVHFWLTFIGFQVTFLVQHYLGIEGMPRRYADYLPSDGWTTLNVVSSIGAAILALSAVPLLWNVWKSFRVGRPVTVDDPWGHGNSLEWATSCPPPRHNFTSLPRIRSERPAFDLHYPEAAEAIAAVKKH